MNTHALVAEFNAAQIAFLNQVEDCGLNYAWRRWFEAANAIQDDFPNLVRELAPYCKSSARAIKWRTTRLINIATYGS